MRLLALCLLMLTSLPSVAQDISFRSPTGNIHCTIFTGSYSGARCDLSKFTPTYSRPNDCDLDWGFAFEVGSTGTGAPICAGDTVINPGAPVLDYGHSVTRASVTCTSEKAGMTCMNAERHGFTVARERQQAF